MIIIRETNAPGVNRSLTLPASASYLRSAVCLMFLCATTLWSAVSTLVPLDATWRYLDNGSNQGTNWIAGDFDDTGWASGRAELGYGDADEVTVVSYGINRNNKYITTYFRTSFDVTNSSAYSGLTLKLIRDDGAVVYLNGVEVVRNNLASGPIDSSTLATGDVEGTAEFTFVSANVSPALLVSGTNVLAVEIHQVSRTSADISFALELTTVRSNFPPAVSILEPTNGSVFIAPAEITIVAEASDSDGTIGRVEFYQGDTLIGQDTNAPYAVTTTLAAGNYQFRVVAVDDLGAHSAAALLSVSVRENARPAVALVSPTNSAVFVSPVDISLLATASDIDGDVVAVDFYADNVLLARTTNSPYSFTWTNAPLGGHALRTIAVDNRDSRSTSAPVNILVRDNAAPQVLLDSPVEGAVFAAPADVTIGGTAVDADGMLSSIELMIGTNQLAVLFSSPFSFTISNAPPGEYSIYAIVTDDTGAKGTSAVVNVSVRIAAVTRGPYLQMGTPSAITVRWRTDLPTDSVVRYGTNAAELNLITHRPVATTEHEVRLTDLLAATRYFYSVGSSRQILGSGAGFSFVTSPATNKATRVWVLGDSGTASEGVKAVRDGYYSFNGTNHTDLWLMLGDNAYYAGTDSEYQAAVFDIFPEMLRQSVLWPAIGNHDFYSADREGIFPYLDIFSLPTAGEAGGVPSGTEKYYSFNFANMHFVCLDSMSVDRSTNSPMFAWLQQDLAANTNEWLIAFWHHPPYSKGSHDSDWEYELIEMREHALPLLESYGVDLVLSGHSHSYERSFLLNGHYGGSDTLMPDMIKDGGDGRPEGSGAYAKSQSEGAVYVVAGSSGWTHWGELNHPAMFISLLEMGSMMLDIHDHVMDVKFLRHDGTIGDSFRIVKGPLSDVFAVASYSITNDTFTLTWNSVPGEYYRVERSESLIAPEWIVSSGSIRAISRKTTWTYPFGDARASFYRIVRLTE